MHLTILLLAGHTHPFNGPIFPVPQVNTPVDVRGPCNLELLSYLSISAPACRLQPQRPLLTRSGLL